MVQARRNSSVRRPGALESVATLALSTLERRIARRMGLQPCRVQIFATDVDNEALERARTGSYPESIALDVTDSASSASSHATTIATRLRRASASA
jgi:chemotaxis methyl-accepting protein methylase